MAKLKLFSCVYKDTQSLALRIGNDFPAKVMCHFPSKIYKGPIQIVEYGERDFRAFFRQRDEIELKRDIKHDAKIFVSAMRVVGASQEVIDAIDAVYPIPVEDKAYILARNEQVAAAIPVKKRQPRTERFVETGKGIKVKKVSAAARFRELILEGKMNDDDIFKTIQNEYGHDDSKRSYVQYYRNELKKKGLLS